MNSVLLFEANHDNAANTGFLLKLADFHCTLARSIEEACNWLKAAQHLVERFDAFLIGTQLDESNRQLLQSVLKSIPGIPLFLIQWDENQPVVLNPHSIISRAENLVSDLRKFFESKDQLTIVKKGDQEMAEELNKDYNLEEAEEDAMKGRYLTFVLAEEGYGLEIRYVTEIIGIQQVTSIPDMPHHVIGVLNLRGKVIPVIDVRMRFHLEERAYDDRTCIIVVDVEDNSVGLVVDKVSEVVDIPTSEIEPAPLSGTKSANVHIRGLGKIGDQVKILLDIERLIQDEDLSEIDTEDAVA